MRKSICLVTPATEQPTYFGAEVFAAAGLSPAAMIADLAPPTVAGLAPPDFDVRICDEFIAPPDLDDAADFIGLTGKSPQAGRILALAKEYRRRGKTVLIGGPFATLTPELVRPHCDILVRGEIEEIAPVLFEDLRRGRWQAEYTGNHPDLAKAPVPRWDRYPNHRAVAACVQTSRGCPYACEFCEAVVYAGRPDRQKPLANVLNELDLLYRLGYRSVHLADDNFNPRRASRRDLLKALAEWNRRQNQGPVYFGVEITLDTGKDPELLRLCAEAGIHLAFVGIETPNVESLRIAGKHHNANLDPVAAVRAFLAHGISVIGGMMVGFDADGPDIFEQQFRFAMDAAVPIFTLYPVVAAPATPLHRRLKAAGRLREEGCGGGDRTPWLTNLVPLGMSREQLFAGMRWLGNRLYHPVFFGERMLRFIDALGDCSRLPGEITGVGTAADRLALGLDLTRLIRQIPSLGSAEAEMWHRVMEACQGKPTTRPHVMNALAQYRQIRHMYQAAGFWDPAAGESPRPLLPA